MKTKQLNSRIDNITSDILAELCKEMKCRQSQVIRKAIFEMAERELGDEKLKEILFVSYGG